MSSLFELTTSADADIEEIVRYTLDQWGAEQATKYVRRLDQHFEAIGSGDALTLTKRIFKNREDLWASRCQKHVVFHQARIGDCPLILAVFHERMDLMVRLKDRLEEAGL